MSDNVAKLKTPNQPPSSLALEFPDCEEVIIGGKHKFVVRIPNEDEWDIVTSAEASGTKTFHTLKSLALSCVVWPDKATVEEKFSKMPGLVSTLGSKVIPRLAGWGLDVETKKFGGG